MVLSVQWMKEVGPITTDLNDLNLSIQYKGSTLKLHAKSSKEGQLKIINGNALQKHCKKWKMGLVAQLTSLCAVPTNLAIDPAIQKVLHHFNEVFNEP